MSLFLRLLKIATLSLLALVFSLSLAITLFFSQPRLHLWLFTQLDDWTDGMLSVAHSEGHLFDVITLHQIRLRHPAIEMDIDRLDWRLDLFHLWYGRLTLDKLHIQNLALVLLEQPTSEPAPPNPQPFAALMSLPYLLELDDIRIANLNLRQGDRLYHIEQLHTALAWQVRRLQMERLSLLYDGHRLDASGHALFLRSDEFSGQLELTLDSASLPPLALQGHWRGNLQTLALELDLSQPFALRSQHQLARGDTTKLQSRWQALHYTLNEPHQLHSPDGELTLELDDGQLQGKAEFNWQLTPFPTAQQGLTFRFDLDDHLKFSLRSDFAAAGLMQLDGQLAIAAQQLQAQLRSQQLALEAFAAPLPIFYSGLATIELEDLTSPRLALELTETELSLPEQQAELRGRLSLKAHDLNSTQIQLQLHHTLLRQGEHQAHISGPINALLSQLDSLQGRLHTPQPLQIDYLDHQASLQWDARLEASQTLLLKHLEMRLGGNRLSAQGEIGDTLQLSVQAALPRLDQLLPDLAGALHLDAQLSGDTLNPQAQLQLDTELLRWQQTELQQGSLKAAFPLLTPWLASAELELGQVQDRSEGAGQILLNSLQLRRRHEGDGMHTHLNLQHPQLALDTTFRDNMRDLEQIGVELLTFSVDNPQTGPWRLHQPSPLQWRSPYALHSEGMCLLNASASFCLQAGADEIAWQLRQLPLFNWLADFLPEGLALDGLFDGEGSLRLGENPLQDWQLQQVLRNPRIDLELDQQGYLLPLTVRQWQAQLEASAQQASLHSEAALNQSGRFELQLDIANPQQKWATATLEGRLLAQLNEAELPEDLLSLLVLHEQQLSLHANLGGTLGAPQLESYADLRLLADLPLLGLMQQRLDLRAVLSDEQISLQGDLQQPEQGRLAIQGQLKAAQGQVLTASLQLQGEDVRLIDSPFASIRSAPDLSIEVRDGALHISGATQLNHSRINLQDVPLQNRTRVSGDEIMLDTEGQAIPVEEAALPLHLDLNLGFGEQVEIHARDVNALLSGQLRLRKIPGEDLRGFGQLFLDQGQIRLDPRNAIVIERSGFSFTGPLGNPSLDVQLYRRVEQIQARLNITGTATSPQFVFYSTPSLSQGNIINIMIFGRAVDVEREPNYESQLLSALYKLGLHGNTPVLSQLTSSLGIHDIYFDIQDESSSNLILGRALTDRLYIRYAMGLSGQQSNAVQMFYRLGRSWVLESLSGDDQQSLDLIWTRER